jgi:hypothetical protein
MGHLFSLDNVIVFVACECFAVPLNIAAGEAFVAGHGDRALLGWGLGVPLAVAGFTFHWWKTKIPDSLRNFIQQNAKYGIVPALLVAFAYVAGPEMYQRATKPVAVTGAIGAMPIGTASMDEAVAQATKKITNEKNEAILGAARMAKERDDAIRQLEDMKRQREATVPNVTFPVSPAPTSGPIKWNKPEEQQLFVVSYDTIGFVVNGALFWGESTEPVSITEAYAISGLTGHKQEIKANVANKGYFPVDKVDIPSGAPVHLDLVWNPPIPLKDFLNQWGKFHVVIKYNGVKFERNYDEALVRQKLQQQAPDMFGPQMTPRDDK